MWKKVLIGVFAVGLIGALAYGAYYRTTSKSNSNEGNQGWDHSENGQQGGGPPWAQVDEGALIDGDAAADSIAINASSSSSEIAANPEAIDQVAETAGYGGGNAESPGYGQTGEEITWLKRVGVVTSVDSEELLIAADEGGEIAITGRPWSFAISQGFSPVVGDQVSVIGFYETADLFSAGQITDAMNGQVVNLRYENGRPLWAGGNGRGNGGNS
jgi:hypothetical protein